MHFQVLFPRKSDEFQEGVQIQLQKVTDEAAAKVEAVLKRSEEQASMIESLHSSVSLIKIPGSLCHLNLPFSFWPPASAIAALL